MEHLIEEQEVVSMGFHKGERILVCTACGEWVSCWDDASVINEFREGSCPGQRQHDDDYEPEEHLKPKFLAAAERRAKKLGVDTSELLEDDLRKLRKSDYEPDEHPPLIIKKADQPVFGPSFSIYKVKVCLACRKELDTGEPGMDAVEVIGPDGSDVMCEPCLAAESTVILDEREGVPLVYAWEGKEE